MAGLQQQNFPMTIYIYMRQSDCLRRQANNKLLIADSSYEHFENEYNQFVIWWYMTVENVSHIVTKDPQYVLIYRIIGLFLTPVEEINAFKFTVGYIWKNESIKGKILYWN